MNTTVWASPLHLEEPAVSIVVGVVQWQLTARLSLNLVRRLAQQKTPGLLRLRMTKNIPE